MLSFKPRKVTLGPMLESEAQFMRNCCTAVRIAANFYDIPPERMAKLLLAQEFEIVEGD